MKHLSNLKFMAMALFVAMLSLSFTACSSDDDDPKEGNSSIIGTWERSGLTINGLRGTALLKFNTNNSGSVTAIYDDGTDSDVYNFQYIFREKEGGRSTVEFIWTGTSYIMYEGNYEYDVSITPDRLVIDGDIYVRK